LAILKSNHYAQPIISRDGSDRIIGHSTDLIVECKHCKTVETAEVNDAENVLQCRKCSCCDLIPGSFNTDRRTQPRHDTRKRERYNRNNSD